LKSLNIENKKRANKMSALKNSILFGINS